jgi:hypothetical protein
MIYYYASEDEEDDITPSDDWYAFGYFIYPGPKRPGQGAEGIQVSLHAGFSKRTQLGWEKIKLVPENMPPEVQQDFMKFIFEAE